MPIAPSSLARFQQRDYLTMVPLGPDPDLAPTEEERGMLWASSLGQQLNWRMPLIRELRNYFNGIQPIKFSTKAWRETYGEDFGMVTSNWCRIAIEAATERMSVMAFRFGGETNDDDEAWDFWQRNRMDLDQTVAYNDMLVTGYSYALVWPDPITSQPEITVEDPLHTIVELDAANRKRRKAAMKRWRRRDGMWEALVFTPDHWWRIEAPAEEGGSTLLEHGVHHLGVVPIIQFTNSPDVYGHGVSDLLPILQLQDAVNKLLSDEMIVAEHAGYPQRVLLGYEVPDDDVDRKALVGGKNRWLAFEGENSKIQELTVADLSNFSKAIEQKVQHVAALMRVPAYYFTGVIHNVSAEALEASNMGLVFRVRGRNRLAGESWEEVLRACFTFSGNKAKGEASRAETVWDDPEITSEATRVDALVKMRSLEIPLVILWEKWGMTPEQIIRAQALREEEIAQQGASYGFSGPSGIPPEPPVSLPATAATFVAADPADPDPAGPAAVPN